jgi:uncharacterized membrane protein
MPSPRTILAAMAVVAVTSSGCTDNRGVTPPPRIAAAEHAERGAGTTFTSFDPPGSTLTLPTDINAQGQIVGRYLNGKTHGFLREPDGTITTIDYPGSSFTVAASINNNGAIVGWYIVPTAPTVRHGFLLQDGVFTSFDPPGSLFTNATGINERGDIVGRYCTLAVCRPVGNGDFHGFLYRDGEFTTLDVPGGTETDAYKPQANGTVLGGFVQSGVEKLFLYRDGEFSPFALPNGKNVTLDDGGINSRGDIVGTYCDAPGICLIGSSTTHGFLWSDGELTTIDYPGARATSALGFNERGDIAGGYIDANGVPRGYLMTNRGGAQ